MITVETPTMPNVERGGRATNERSPRHQRSKVALSGEQTLPIW